MLMRYVSNNEYVRVRMYAYMCMLKWTCKGHVDVYIHVYTCACMIILNYLELYVLYLLDVLYVLNVRHSICAKSAMYPEYGMDGMYVASVTHLIHACAVQCCMHRIYCMHCMQSIQCMPVSVMYPCMYVTLSAFVCVHVCLPVCMQAYTMVSLCMQDSA